MVFTSLAFFIFFGIVYCLYRILPFRAQNVMLLLASYIFYGWWSIGLVFLIVLTTSVDFSCALMIGEGKYVAEGTPCPLHHASFRGLLR